MHWRSYRDLVTHHPSVVGELLVYQGLESPELGNRRDLLVWLPPSYWAGAKRHYPVIYMQDGQNLFDATASYAGEWQVDETLTALAHEGLEAIVVGVPNAGVARSDEYSPYRDPRLGGGQGDRYLRFLLATVRPLVTASFRADADRRATAIMGSSMGGLISLYAFFRYPETFGLVGALSPALWFARGRTVDYIQRRPPFLGRIYLDIGTAEEAPSPARPAGSRRPLRTLSMARRLAEELVRKGYTPGFNLHYVEEEGAPHHESAWARRLPTALRFLLARQ